MKHIALLCLVFVSSSAAIAQERLRYAATSASVKVIQSSGPSSVVWDRGNGQPAEQTRTEADVIIRSAPHEWTRDMRAVSAGESESRSNALGSSRSGNAALAGNDLRRSFSQPISIATGIKAIDGSSLRGHSTGSSEIDSYIVDSSLRFRIDPLLIYSQMGKESSYKPKALSPKGASGLMQLMPKTASRMGVTDIYDPKQNIEGGVRYMRLLLDMFDGDVSLALAGYNAGEQAVVKYNYQIPPYKETQDYVARIISRYETLRSPRATVHF